MREVDRLNELISNFLEYCRPYEATLETVALHELLSEVVELLQRDERSRGIQFDFETPQDAMVLSDSHALRRVVVNLLVNALETDPAPTTIRIKVESKRDFYRLIIEDDGPGIPEAERERIFEPFFTTKHGGSGLGLATAFRLMQEVDGSISVSEARVLTGARFELRIPAAVEEASDTPQTMSQTNDSEAAELRVHE